MNVISSGRPIQLFTGMTRRQLLARIHEVRAAFRSKTTPLRPSTSLNRHGHRGDILAAEHVLVGTSTRILIAMERM